MPFFCVLIEGSNICILGQGDAPSMTGFFSSQVLWASSARDAERKALQSIRLTWNRGVDTKHLNSIQPNLNVSETSRSTFSQWLFHSNSGNVFFPDERDDESQ